MPRHLVLALVAALAVCHLASAYGSDVTMELRVFNGGEEVTPQTRLAVHRAGDRGDAGLNASSADGRARVQVPQGIYDVQAIHEREGKVVNIRWANRLVVMPYPDEPGLHLEVINFKTGFGALQVRDQDNAHPDVAIYEPDKHEKPAAPAHSGSVYALFVVPAGTYDLQIRSGGKIRWQNGLEVPLDRTRLWVVGR
jgi:hypothetical protein